MAESLFVDSNSNKLEKYQSLYPQIEALLLNEKDLIANLANFSAALKQVFGFFWVGFYLVKDVELVLGPFQGPIACTRIPFNKGVCGHCYTTKNTILVSDVEAFPGHIACSSDSKSEIVLPVFGLNQEIIAVLDIDSDKLNDFDETDKDCLEKLILLLNK